MFSQRTRSNSSARLWFGYDWYSSEAGSDRLFSSGVRASKYLRMYSLSSRFWRSNGGLLATSNSFRISSALRGGLAAKVFVQINAITLNEINIFIASPLASGIGFSNRRHTEFAIADYLRRL